MATPQRIGGNLARVTWTTDGTAAVTGEGAATIPPALNVAEFTSWNFNSSFEVEDTTPLASDSPRVDVDMRRPDVIECEGFVAGTGGDGSNKPAGIPRLPYTHSDGSKPTAKLTLIMDKTAGTPANDSYTMDAFYVGTSWHGASRGGRKQRVVYRFVPTGAITQVSNGVSTTIK